MPDERGRIPIGLIREVYDVGDIPPERIPEVEAAVSRMLDFEIRVEPDEQLARQVVRRYHHA